MPRSPHLNLGEETQHLTMEGCELCPLIKNTIILCFSRQSSIPKQVLCVHARAFLFRLYCGNCGTVQGTIAWTPVYESWQSDVAAKVHTCSASYHGSSRQVRATYSGRFCMSWCFIFSKIWFMDIVRQRCFSGEHHDASSNDFIWSCP